MSSSLQSHFKKGWRGGGNGKGLCAQSVRKEEKKFPDEKSRFFGKRAPPVQGNKTENGAIRESFKKVFNTVQYVQKNSLSTETWAKRPKRVPLNFSVESNWTKRTRPRRSAFVEKLSNRPGNIWTEPPG